MTTPPDIHWRDFTREMHFVYVLRGPSGVYVGCTSQPEQRLAQHFFQGVSGFHTQPVHRAMRIDGAAAWSSEIVAQAFGIDAGRDVELALILQLRADGERVLNERPPDPSLPRRKNRPRWNAADRAARGNA